jgi:succinoglycan biosynthesis transport protein ExoP
MNFRQFLSILKARRWLFVAVLLGVLVPAVLISLLLPKRYAAEASVVVEVKPDPISGSAFQSMMTPTLVATQIDIIGSERVARRVVRSLRLTENAQIREQWQSETEGRIAIETWLVEQFSKQLDVKPGRESSVITISYSAPDPAFAAGLANAYAQAYLDTVLELRVDPARQYSTFFEERVKEARAKLEAAQSKLSAFQRENGVVMADERMDVETQRLNELSSQLVGLQTASADSTSRRAQAVGGAADRLQEITGNPVVAQLRAELSRLEARQKELGARLGERHPQVVELSANVNELRLRIDAEIKRLSAGVSTTDAINRQREAQVRGELEAQRSKLLKAKQMRDPGFADLARRRSRSARLRPGPGPAHANQLGKSDHLQQRESVDHCRPSPPSRLPQDSTERCAGPLRWVAVRSGRGPGRRTA